MAHANFMQYTLRICNTYSFPTTVMAVRTGRNVTSYAHRQPYAAFLFLFIHRIVILLVAFLLVAFLHIRIVTQLFIFLFSSSSTSHASLRARLWNVGAHIRNKTAATSLHHWALCVRNMSMTKSIKVSVSCNGLVMFLCTMVSKCANAQDVRVQFTAHVTSLKHNN